MIIDSYNKGIPKSLVNVITEYEKRVGSLAMQPTPHAHFHSVKRNLVDMLFLDARLGQSQKSKVYEKAKEALDDYLTILNSSKDFLEAEMMTSSGYFPKQRTLLEYVWHAKEHLSNP